MKSKGQKPWRSYTALIFLMASVSALISCSGSGDIDDITTPTSTGKLLIQIQDAPLDNLVKFEITVDSIELNPGNVQALDEPKEIELTSLQLTADILPAL